MRWKGGIRGLGSVLTGWGEVVAGKGGCNSYCSGKEWFVIRSKGKLWLGYVLGETNVKLMVRRSRRSSEPK
jgi:hypothetical protein